MIYRRLREQRSYSTGLSGLTSYDSKTDYTVSYTTNPTQTAETQTTYDSTGKVILAQTVNTFSGSPLDALTATQTSCNQWNEGLLQSVAQGYQNGNALVTVTNTYNPFVGCQSSNTGSNPTIASTQTTLNDISTNNTKTVFYNYDIYNDVTGIVETDWGGGGVLLNASMYYTFPSSGPISLPQETVVFGQNAALASDTKYSSYDSRR